MTFANILKEDIIGDKLSLFTYSSNNVYCVIAIQYVLSTQELGMQKDGVWSSRGFHKARFAPGSLTATIGRI